MLCATWLLVFLAAMPTARRYNTRSEDMTTAAAAAGSGSAPRSTSTAAGVTTLADDDAPSPCGTCSSMIGHDVDALECELCKAWTHGKQECSGLPYKVFKNIVDYSKHGVTYVCTSCRLGRDNSSGSKNSDFTQLFETVKGLSSAVAKLSAEIRDLKSQNNNSVLAPAPVPVGGAHQPYDPVSHQRWVREDVREFLERDKRRDSVIIRGIPSTNLHASFPEVAKYLCPDLNITLSGVVPIKPNLIRAKIIDSLHRSELLTKSRNLAGSPFSSVFISRDLTYKQRQELREKRAAAGAGGSGLAAGRGNVGSSSGSSTARVSSVGSGPASGGAGGSGVGDGGLQGADGGDVATVPLGSTPGGRA